MRSPRTVDRCLRSWNTASAMSRLFLLLQLIGHLRDSRHGAGLVAGRGRAADADGADGLVADLDRHATPQCNDVFELALAGELRARLGARSPIGRGAAKRARRIGLALRQLDIVRRRLVALEKDAQTAGA